jgi:hypothetical protein
MRKRVACSIVLFALIGRTALSGEPAWMLKTFYGYGFWPGMMEYAYKHNLGSPAGQAGGFSLGVSGFYRINDWLQVGAEMAYAPMFNMNREEFARAFSESVGTVNFNALSLYSLGRFSLSVFYLELGVGMSFTPALINVETGEFSIIGLENGKTFGGPDLVIPWGAGVIVRLLRQPYITLDINIKSYHILGNEMLQKYAELADSRSIFNTMISSIDIGACVYFGSNRN